MRNTVKSSALLMLPLLLLVAGCAGDGADRGPSYGYVGAGSYGDYYDGRDYWYYDRDGKRHRRGDRDGHHHHDGKDHDGKDHDGKWDRDGKWGRDWDRDGDRTGNREERRAGSDGEDRRGDNRDRTREEDERGGRDGLTLRQQENQRSGGSAVGGYNAPPVERIAPAGGDRGGDRDRER